MFSHKTTILLDFIYRINKLTTSEVVWADETTEYKVGLKMSSNLQHLAFDEVIFYMTLQNNLTLSNIIF